MQGGASEAFEEGRRALAAGQGDAAVLAFRRAAGLAPEDPEPLRELARVYVAFSDWTLVAEVAGALLRLAPTDGDARRLAAWSALQLSLMRFEDGVRTAWSGDRGEGQGLQDVHDAVAAVLDAGIPPAVLPWTVTHVLMRLMAHDLLERTGGFEVEGRRWAGAGESRNLLMQQARARPTAADRLELIAQHRLWGARAEAAAPVLPPSVPPPRGDRIRLGFLSADLRLHAVGVFAWPLFEHPDPRFELYVYSVFPGEADSAQAAIAERVAAYRHVPQASDAEVVGLIAADGLDILIDLGGPTGWNRPQLMAARPAPLQMSWLGYAHSSGLSAIDRIILDPYLVPPDPALLLERPLLMPTTWIVLSEANFREDPPVRLDLPEARNGFITFGTANATYKYSPSCLDLWARVLAACPNSRFLVVRPEAGAPAFRENLLRAFARRGVGPERIRFEPVRGGHLPLYGEMDISLDTSPLTGGTTTCESLWMGVPVISLVGEALYERLSYSILSNAGLGDLAVETPDAYVEAAVELAGDRARRESLRANLRDRLRTGPLGRTEAFAKDFYDMLAVAVAGGA